MSYKTVEVELDHGRIYPCGAEALPANGHALLTLLDSGLPPARNCGELARRWEEMDELTPEEAESFANDIEQSRDSLPSPKSLWD